MITEYDLLAFSVGSGVDSFRPLYAVCTGTKPPSKKEYSAD